MTVLTSESQLVLGTTATLPRVNLLPPEIAEKRAFRRIQFALGAALLAAAGVVGLLFVAANGSVSQAQQSLDARRAAQTTLVGQMGKYNDVTRVYASAAAAQTALASAMGDEIRYSQMLNDLSLTIPDNVWLKTLSYAQVAPAAGAAPVGPATVGTLNINGVAFSHDDVAVLLESLMGLKTYTNAYFNSSTEALIGTRKTVNYVVTASMTNAAQSARYSKPFGG